MLNPIAERTPPSIDDVDALPGQAWLIGRQLADHVMQIDQALAGIDDLLNILQPPRTGKIRIEWWRRHGRVAPTPAAWIQLPGNSRWRAERLPIAGLSKRVKKARAFHDFHRQVQALCQEASKLLVMRHQAMERIAMFQRTTAGLLSENERRLHASSSSVDMALAKAKLLKQMAAGVPDAETLAPAEFANE